MNRGLLLTLWISSVTFFVLGLIFPIMHTKNQVMGIVLESKNIRLYDSVLMFYHENEYLLAFIIFFFTITLPIVKYICLFNKIFTIFETSKNTSKILALLDKWSMLDVFLVALLLLNFKMDSQIVVMKMKVGVAFLAFSVVTMIIFSSLNSKNMIDGN